MNKILLLVALALFAVSAPASDAIYKWVDEEGVTHFSAQPPEDVDYERVSAAFGTRAGPSTSEPAESAVPEDADEDADSDEADEPTSAEEIAERCEQARENLEILRERERVALQRDDEGEEEELDAERREEVIAETQAYIDEWC